MIYFDNASTTLLNPVLLDTYNNLVTIYFANSSALHSLGREVAELENQARQEILKTLHFSDGKVIFTSSASEANNLTLIGLFKTYSNRGNEIIISDFEHPSVLESVKYLEKEYGAHVHIIPLVNGRISLTSLKEALSEKTVIVSIMAVNNEVGTITHLEEIRALLKDYPKVIFHSDVTQAVGKIDVNYECADVLTFSAHKIHGLKGSGVIVAKNKLKFAPLIHGGKQEYGFRAGTSNAPTNILFARTIRLAISEQKSNFSHVLNLAQKLNGLLIDKPEYFKINSTLDNPYIVNFSLLSGQASHVLNGLEMRKIYLGTTSSCSAKLDQKSRSVLALTGSESLASNALRVSFSSHNTIAEVETFFKAMMEIIRGE